MSSHTKVLRNCIAIVTGGWLVLAGAGASRAERAPAPLSPEYVEECGSCHIAFSPRHLDLRSWHAVMSGLGDHFGTDASLDPQRLESIRAWLEAGARRRETTGPDGRPLLRITETRWFRHEHDEVPARFWTGPDAVKPLDCAACHRQAAQGRYGERSLTLPSRGETR